MQIKGKYVAALNPATKQVYALPYTVEKIVGTGKAKLSFNKNSDDICIAEKNTAMSSFAPVYGNSSSMEVTPGHKICASFDAKEGFAETFVRPINIKTGKEVSWW